LMLSLLAVAASFQCRHWTARQLVCQGNSAVTMSVPLRRSSRIRALSNRSAGDGSAESENPAKKTKRTDKVPTDQPQVPPKKAKRRSMQQKATAKAKSNASNVADYLPRNREQELASDSFTVIGVDEAGRGPLAGPVVAAAAIVPENLPGIIDSKKITKEAVREELYDKLIQSANIRWAVAVVDAATIDEINILQASMKAMAMAAACLIDPSGDSNTRREASTSHEGCYVVHGDNLSSVTSKKEPKFYCLVDGNRVPDNMPCPCEPMVKGDGREYSIGAASILAKVTRDRLMRQYDALYPWYGLGTHKGYPTAAHMKMVSEHGASPIHRRTFAPLKHMTFDEAGRVIDAS